MFLHCPVILLALVFSVSISEANVLAKPGTGSSDVCHSAQAYSNSLDSLMGLCDGVSSFASDQCTVPTVEILKPCVHGGLVDSSCFRNSILPILGRGSERECICGGLHHLLSMSLAVEAMMCFDDGRDISISSEVALLEPEVILRGCNVAKCKLNYGIGTSAACTVSKVGGLVTVPALCTLAAVFTFGLSCAVGLAITGISAGLCELLPDIADEACQCPKARIFFPDDSQIEQLVNTGASDAQIQAKFPNLGPTDLHILETRVSLLRGQREIVEHLNVLSADIRTVLAKVNLAIIASLYSRYIDNLQVIEQYWRDIPAHVKNSTNLGSSTYFQLFSSAALHPLNGAMASVKMVLQMLTGDHSILYPGSVYKHLPEFCTLDAYQVFMGLVSRGMSQYKVALKVVHNVSISPVLLKEWNLEYAKAMEAFAFYCRCPFPGTVLKKSSNITSMMSNLPPTWDSVAINKMKVAQSDFSSVTKKQMTMLLGIKNFEPNIEARDLLGPVYMEDVSTLVLLHNQNQSNFAVHFDNISRCVDWKANDLVCESGWTLYTNSANNSNCFKWADNDIKNTSMPIPISWNDANSLCQSLIHGGELASVHDNGTNYAVGNITGQQGHTIPRGYGFWLGGYKENGTWLWSDKSQWHYKNWGSGEPEKDGNYLHYDGGLFQDLFGQWSAQSWSTWSFGAFCQYKGSKCVQQVGIINAGSAQQKCYL